MVSVDEYPADAVTDSGDEPADGGGHDRRAARLRLQRDEPEGLVVARYGDEVGRPVQVGQPVVAQRREEPHRGPDAERAGQAGQVEAAPAVTADDRHGEPVERREELWAWLLQRNARMYGVAFAIDKAGDVYLTGRVPLHAVTAEELDRLLGAVLTYADESFDTMLSIGFGDAIRREWAWRVKRGESLANLQAFAHLVEPPS